MPNSLNDVVFIENAVYTLLIESTGFDADIKLAVGLATTKWWRDGIT